MVFFIDESGHPHPNDPVPCPVLAAVGVPASRSRSLMRTLFRLKRDILGVTEVSPNDDRFKAKAVLNEFAGVVRQHWQQSQHGWMPPPVYAAAIEGLYREIRRTVVDLEIPNPSGTGTSTLYGEYRMGAYYWEDGG